MQASSSPTPNISGSSMRGSGDCVRVNDRLRPCVGRTAADAEAAVSNDAQVTLVDCSTRTCL